MSGITSRTPAPSRVQHGRLSSPWHNPCWEGVLLKASYVPRGSVRRFRGSSRSKHNAQRSGFLQVEALLFDAPPFDESKLSVVHLPCAFHDGSQPPMRRRYTLTHNDITGALLLTIGSIYNPSQLDGWYVKLLRDEVLAEWRYCAEGRASLHVHCHVSGEERWIASPQLRNYIFQREMPLVLETIRHAERDLLQSFPQLASAPVLVHMASHIAEYNATLEWGPLGQPESWRRPPQSILQSFLQSFSEPQRGSALPQRSSSQPATVLPLFPTSSQGGGQGGQAGRLDDGQPALTAPECVTVCEAVDVGNGTVLVCETVCTDTAAQDTSPLSQTDGLVVLQSDSFPPAAQHPAGPPQRCDQKPVEDRSGGGRSLGTKKPDLWVPSLDGVRQEVLRPVERAGPRKSASVGGRVDGALARPLLVPADPVTLASQAARHLQLQQKVTPGRLASCTALLQQTM